ncbi:MAG: hypothetical protein IPJ41_10550 [Phycisphaerales bacterium]|nr:hypothetical protein [Phycisphaerales bacterium]
MRKWRDLCVVLAVLLGLGALARGATTTSGTVVQSGSGAAVTWGWVGLINRQTLNLYAEGQQVWFNQLAELDAAGHFSFTIDDSDPSYGEFYLYTLSPLHLNEISGGVTSTLAFPLRSDFSRPGVVSFSGSAQHTGLMFEIESNRSTHRVLMRDGLTELATDVYLASPTAASPTILSRTPYNKDGMWASAWYCLWGYNVVAQDSRGRFASDGVDAIFRGWLG